MAPITAKNFQINQIAAKTGDDKIFKDMINNQLYKTYNLMLIAKKSTYNQRIDFTVQKISPFNTKETNRGVLDILKSYKSKEVAMTD